MADNAVSFAVSYSWITGFSGSSAGKESACNAGDPSLIPRSGRYPGEGIGYPLQYCWASLVAQTVKNPPAMWETWVPSLGWEDPLEEGMATHCSILAWRSHMDRGAWQVELLLSFFEKQFFPWYLPLVDTECLTIGHQVIMRCELPFMNRLWSDIPIHNVGMHRTLLPIGSGIYDMRLSRSYRHK